MLTGPVQISNIVTTFNLDRKLSREKIKKHFPTIKYVPKFSGGILKYPDGCMLIFDTGRINVTGVSNVAIAMWLVDRFCRLYPEDIKQEKHEIVNITAHSRLVSDFDYTKLQQHPRFTYEPELFPGMHVRVDQSKVIFIIFRTSGKITITGVKKLESIDGYFHELEHQLSLI